MASTYTTNKNIEKPGYNDYASNPTGWSEPVNTDWDIIDKGFGGVLTKNTTGGTTNLTITETQNLIIVVTGTLVSNATLTLPLNSAASAITAGQWIVRNDTTGSYTLTIAPVSGGGTTALVTQGETVCVYCEGTNVDLADNPTTFIDAALASRSVIAGTALTGGGALSANVTLNADQATAQQWRENTANKLLNANAVWSSMSETVLTDAATISWDMQSGFDFIVTLGANRTLANPTNIKVGQKGRLIVQQDGTGSRTLTWSSYYKFANGTAPTLSTAANSVDVFYYDVRSSTYIIISLAGRAFA